MFGLFLDHIQAIYKQVLADVYAISWPCQVILANFENFYERLNNFAEENDVDDGDAESDLIDEFVEREKRSVDDSASADSTLELELQHAKARRRRQRHQGSNLQNVF